MKAQLKNLVKFGAVALFGFAWQANANAQCDSWDKYPQGAEEAKKAHVIYRDKLTREKNHAEAYKLWEELFKYVQVPLPAKTTHFMDGADMCFHFAKNEKDATLKKEWIEKAIALYDKNAVCNGEDAVNRAYQGYYMYANGYDVAQAYKVFEKSLELGKDTPPPMILSYMSTISVYFFRTKVAGFDAKYMVALYERFKKVVELNEKGKDAANYKKYWLEVEKQFNLIPEIFGCEFWVEKLKPQVKVQWENPDSLKFIATKLAEKCGKENALYLEVYTRYRFLIVGVETERQKAILKSDTSTVYSKILACRILTELDTVNAADYKAKEWALNPELATSNKEWVDNDTRGKAIYRYAFQLYKDGNFSGARTYCRLTSKFLPNWGDPYLLVGTMYASSGPRCSAEGRGFDAQVCVWTAIDEWVKAKSVDPSAASEANRLIGNYSGFMPTKSELAQRGIAEGSSFTVPCWIQQATVARGL